MKTYLDRLIEVTSAPPRLQPRHVWTGQVTTTPRRVGCSCGKREAHILARRTTADGCAVLLWSDGDLTTGGLALIARGLPLDTAWLLMGDVCLYALDEVRTLARAARKAARKHTDSQRLVMRAEVRA